MKFCTFSLSFFEKKQSAIIQSLVSHLNNVVRYRVFDTEIIDSVLDKIKELNLIDLRTVVCNGETNPVLSTEIQRLLDNQYLSEALRYCQLYPSKAPLCYKSLADYFETDIIPRVSNVIEIIGYRSIDEYLSEVHKDMTCLLPEDVRAISDDFMPISIHMSESTHPIEFGAKKITCPDKWLMFRYVFEIKFTIRNTLFIVKGFFPNKPVAVSFPIHPFYANMKEELKKITNTFPEDFTKNFYIDLDLQDFFLAITENAKEEYAIIYEKFKKYTQWSFMDCMKTFFSPDITAVEMFSIIKTLLLGSKENQNVAFLLIGLLKDKKNTTTRQDVVILLYMFFDNLSQRLQLLLQGGNSFISEEFDKIKNACLNTNVDLKTQVLTHKTMPLSVKSAAMEKIEEMALPGAETKKQHLYVSTLLRFPWVPQDKDLIESDSISIAKSAGNVGIQRFIRGVKDSLDNIIFGHTEAKQMLMYFLGKWCNNELTTGGYMALVGPPGVGKTLFSQSISHALGIPFVQLTLGGQNDGEILHGHGYTYSGSTPGMIVKKMIEAGHSRCVFLLDELDKCSSRNGSVNEIMSILIHLTDPNMNAFFQDRFFQGIDFPMNRALLILSYNDASLIDPILLDRLVQIEMKGFTFNEKITIVRRFIIPSLCKEIELPTSDFHITDEIISYIIKTYTNEAGVRGIKKCMEKLILYLNLQNLMTDRTDIIRFDDTEFVDSILDQPKIKRLTYISEARLLGVCHCIYVTNNGVSGISTIQVIPHTVKRDQVVVTGNVGKVMTESMNCALTATINYMESLGAYDYSNKYPYGFHVHLLDGSQPKDGPSAGAVFAICFLSIFLNRQIPQNIAISGEIDAFGKMYSVGSTTTKIEGARMANLRKVYLSSETNRNLIKDIDLDNSVEIIFCDHISDLARKIFHE